MEVLVQKRHGSGYKPPPSTLGQLVLETACPSPGCFGPWPRGTLAPVSGRLRACQSPKPGGSRCLQPLCSVGLGLGPPLARSQWPGRQRAWEAGGGREGRRRGSAGGALSVPRPPAPDDGLGLGAPLGVPAAQEAEGGVLAALEEQHGQQQAPKKEIHPRSSLLGQVGGGSGLEREPRPLQRPRHPRVLHPPLELGPRPPNVSRSPGSHLGAVQVVIKPAAVGRYPHAVLGVPAAGAETDSVASAWRRVAGRR